MTARRLLMVGGFVVLGGAVLLVFAMVGRTEEPHKTVVPRDSGFGQVAVRITDASAKTRKGCLLAARTERQRSAA